MTDALQKAKDTLQITDVYVRDMTAHCYGDFEPKYYPNLETLDIASKHFVEKVDVVELDAKKFMRVFINLGVRWVDPTANSEELGLKAQIEAVFVVEYFMTEELVKESIDAFALSNASYHVWPYWRELLMNQAARMHLPRIALPTIQLAKKP
ncbi:MAG: preprotein translocase subunit SecB [Thiomicrospira sp.]